MNPDTILGTGLNGLIGSKLVSDFSDTYRWKNLDVSDPKLPTDITNREQVLSTVSATPAPALVHFAAFTDVTKAWEQQGQTTGVAYQVNVIGTENIIAACEATQTHLIHISTAYVFDGNTDRPYTEEDTPNPIEWYGETKWQAEQRVMKARCPWTILRIDQPFRSDPFPKPDVVRKTLALMTAEPPKPIFANHYFGPTYIDDFVRIIDWVIRTKTTGLFHASSGEVWSDFEFAQALVAAQNLNLIPQAGDLEEYLKTLNRPYQRYTGLATKKISEQLDFEPRTIKEALAECQIDVTG